MMSVSFETANEYLRDLERLRRSQETVIAKINKIHSRLQKTSPDVAEKFQEKLWNKLRALYTEAKVYADDEDRISTALIGQIDTLVAPGQVATHRKKSEGGEQKRKRMKADADGSRLASPSITLRSPAEHGTVLVGDQVAARVSLENADKDEWIVVKVIRFDRESNKCVLHVMITSFLCHVLCEMKSHVAVNVTGLGGTFCRVEVIDEEPGDDEESVQRKYKLPHTCIIPFPKPSDPSSAPDFTTGSPVLAVYPGTTALYKATVAAHRKRKTDEYLLEFDDDEEEGVDGLPQRPVPFYRVVQLPEGHKQ